MRDSINLIAGLGMALLMVACSAPDGIEDTPAAATNSIQGKMADAKKTRPLSSSTKLEPVSTAEAAACVASSTSKRASDKVGNEKTCTLSIPDRLTMKIFASDQNGCRPIVISVGPQADPTRAVRLITSHGGKKYYSSVSLRNRALPDRLSGWVYYGGIDGYPEVACETLDFKLEDVLCIRSQSLSAEYEPCDDILVEPPEMFKSVDMNR